jgi:hypothetical protein
MFTASIDALSCLNVLEFQVVARASAMHVLRCTGGTAALLPTLFRIISVFCCSYNIFR